MIFLNATAAAVSFITWEIFLKLVQDTNFKRVCPSHDARHVVNKENTIKVLNGCSAFGHNCLIPNTTLWQTTRQKPLAPSVARPLPDRWRSEKCGAAAFPKLWLFCCKSSAQNNTFLSLLALALLRSILRLPLLLPLTLSTYCHGCFGCRENSFLTSNVLATTWSKVTVALWSPMKPRGLQGKNHTIQTC